MEDGSRDGDSDHVGVIDCFGAGEGLEEGWMISHPSSRFRTGRGWIRQHSEWTRPFVGEEVQEAVRDASSPRQYVLTYLSPDGTRSVDLSPPPPSPNTVPPFRCGRERV